jgi:hypothetical protein
MKGRRRIALLSAMPIAAVVAVLALTRDSSVTPTPGPVAAKPDQPAPAAAPAVDGRTAREDCSTRSEANFPRAFTDPRNLVVGPLVLVGGAATPASTVRDFGGNKFPLLVRVGHTVTVRLIGRTRGLAYGPLPQGETKMRDTYRTVTFVACATGSKSQHYSADGPSGSYADDVPVTFWSGFVLSRAPACIPLAVYVDDERAPRRVGLPLGRDCRR